MGADGNQAQLVFTTVGGRTQVRVQLPTLVSDPHGGQTFMVWGREADAKPTRPTPAPRRGQPTVRQPAGAGAGAGTSRRGAWQLSLDGLPSEATSESARRHANVTALRTLASAGARPLRGSRTALSPAASARASAP